MGTTMQTDDGKVVVTFRQDAERLHLSCGHKPQVPMRTSIEGVAYRCEECKKFVSIIEVHPVMIPNIVDGKPWQYRHIEWKDSVYKQKFGKKKKQRHTYTLVRDDSKKFEEKGMIKIEGSRSGVKMVGNM